MEPRPPARRSIAAMPRWSATAQLAAVSTESKARWMPSPQVRRRSTPSPKSSIRFARLPITACMNAGICRSSSELKPAMSANSTARSSRGSRVRRRRPRRRRVSPTGVDDIGRPARGRPGPDVRRRARSSGRHRGVAVPHDDLTGVRLELAGVAHRIAHGDSGAEGEGDVVADERTVRGVGHRRRSIETGAHPPDPAVATVGDRHLHEVVDRERQQHVQLGPASQQRLGHQDVTARGQRPEPSCGTRALEAVVHVGGDASFLIGGKAPGRVLGCDAMAGVVHDGRVAQGFDQRSIDTHERTDEPQLATRRSARGVRPADCSAASVTSSAARSASRRNTAASARVTTDQ